MATEVAVLHVAIVLDITGSMGGQIAGVKEMIGKYVSQFGEDASLVLHIITYSENQKASYVSHFSGCAPEVRAFVDAITLAVDPATVASANGDDGPENALHGLVMVHEHIPTGTPVVAFLITDASIHFSSDVGPTARVERDALRQLHYGEGSDFDGFKMLDEIVGRHAGKLVLIPIVYSDVNPIMWHWFYQAAFLTGGCVLSSKRGADSSQLANGMSLIVRGIHESRLNGRALADSITQAMWADIDAAFVFYNLSVEFAAAEDEVAARAPDILATPLNTRAVGAKQCLMGLFEMCVKIEGRKFSKRLKNVKITSTLYQARFMCHLARLACESLREDGAVPREHELKMTYQVGLELLHCHLGDTDAPECKIFRRFMEHAFLVEKSDDGEIISTQLNMDAIRTRRGCTEAEAPISIITLETIDDACQSLPATLEQAVATFTEDAELDLHDVDIAKDLMQAVLRLVHVVLVDIRLPLDPVTKQPDFMDAWSSAINDIGVSVLTAYDAMQLADSEAEDGKFRDPQMPSTKKYNAAIPLIYLNNNRDNDALATFIFRALSSLPLLDQITTYLVAGNPNIFPNLNSGILASVAMHIFNAGPGEIRTPGKEAKAHHGRWLEQNLLRSLMSSLEAQGRPVGGSVVAAIRKCGTLNPADNVSKLMGAIYWLYCAEKRDGREEIEWGQVLTYLAEEWISALIMKHDRYNNHIRVGLKKDEAALDHAFFLPPSALLREGTPSAWLETPSRILEQLHPLELVGFKAILAHKLASQGAVAAQNDVAERRALASFFTSAYLIDGCRNVAADSVVNAHAALFARIERGLNAFHSQIGDVGAFEAPVLDLKNIFLESWLMEKRTARYACEEDPETQKVSHRRLCSTKGDDVPRCEDLIVSYLREATLSDLSQIKRKRDELRIQELRRNVVQFGSERAERGSYLAEFDADIRKFLQENVYTANALVKALNVFQTDFEAQNPEFKSPRNNVAVAELFTWKLTRRDVMPLLREAHEILPTDVKRHLVLDTSWTREPPSMLRTSLPFLRATVFPDAPAIFLLELECALRAREVCLRTTGANRHGHTATNPCPDLLAVDEPYITALLEAAKESKNIAKIRRKCDQKRDFLLFAGKLDVAKSGSFFALDENDESQFQYRVKRSTGTRRYLVENLTTRSVGDVGATVRDFLQAPAVVEYLDGVISELSQAISVPTFAQSTVGRKIAGARSFIVEARFRGLEKERILELLNMVNFSSKTRRVLEKLGYLLRTHVPRDV